MTSQTKWPCSGLVVGGLQSPEINLIESKKCKQVNKQNKPKTTTAVLIYSANILLNTYCVTGTFLHSRDFFKKMLSSGPWTQVVDTGRIDITYMFLFLFFSMLLWAHMVVSQ